MTRKVTFYPLSGSYENLSLPVLGKVGIHHELILYYNESYKALFLKGKADNAQEFILKQLDDIENKKMYHLNGQIYHVDIHPVSDEICYYFFSPSMQSTNNSFLWLKHDLLNILNPIMGFSDILSESTLMNEEDMILVKRVKANAEKLYKEIQKIAALQQLQSKMPETAAGKYNISDFINEIVDKLKNIDILTEAPKIVISHSGMVSDEVATIIFRSTLEELLVTFINFQSLPELKILLFPYNHTFRLKFQFPKCNLPQRMIDEFIEVQNFIQGSGLISKLQLASANFLLMCELTQIMGGDTQVKYSDQDLALEIILPSLSEDENQYMTKNQLNNTDSVGQISPKSIHPDLLASIKSNYDKFGGFFILDEWEELASSMNQLNKEYQNPDIERIIIDIQSATSSFDVERLRRINSLLQQLLSI